MSAPNTPDKFDVLVIDVMNLYHRNYHTKKDLTTFLPDGSILITGGVFGFVKATLAYQNKYLEEGGKVFFVMDRPWQEDTQGLDSRSIRRSIDPEYKANRKPKPPEFEAGYYQLVPILKCLLNNAFMVSQPGYEADDLVLPVIQTYPPEKKILVISNDSDWSRCLSGNVWQLKSEAVLSAEAYKDHTGYDPATGVLIEKCFRGDDDNIPNAVPRLPSVVLFQICQTCTSIDDLFNRLDTLDFVPPQWKLRIKAGHDRLKINEKLVGFLPIDRDLFRKSMMRTGFSAEKLRLIYSSLGFSYGKVDLRVMEYDPEFFE